MSNKEIIENLEAKHKHAERQVDFYAKQEKLAEDDEKRAFNTGEKMFWLGISYGVQGALGVVEHSSKEAV